MSFSAAGGGPLARAQVAVYYLPFNPAIRETDPQMATGTTGSTGQFTASLDTSMVQTTDLADVQGHQAFNALVVAETDNQVAVEAAVVSLGASTTATATARRAPADLARSLPNLPARLADQIVRSTYRYVTIAALNSAYGVQAGLQYTYTTETGRQTTLGVAGNFENYGWSASGSMTEQTDRTIDAPWRHWNSYHQYVFANYYWQEHFIVLGIRNFEYLWEPDHFAGQVTDSNPNINRDDHVIGRIAYHEPAFTNCNGNCWFVLNQYNSGWGRDSGTRLGYSWSMAVASWLYLDAWATYGSITYVHWYWLRNGCGGHYSRVIWGDSVDPGIARVIQSSCMPTPSP